MIHPKAIITLAAVFTFPAFIIFSKGNLAANIKVENSAEGNNSAAASWTLEKSTQTVNMQLRPGDSATVHYEINANKELVNSQSGATGTVCIKNNSREKVENLTATTKIQFRERHFQFKDITGATIDQTFTQVGPRSSSCQDFQINFEPVANAKKYRALSSVTFTKAGKKESKEIIRKDTDTFAMTQTTTSTGEAEITDVLTCPTGYTCQSTATFPQKITDTQTIGYDVTITNEDALCEDATELANVAKLTELTTNNSVESPTTIPINTGPC